MVFFLKTPQGSWQSEKQYVGHVVLSEFLGVDSPVIQQGDSDDWMLGDGVAWIRCPDLFFPHDCPSLYLTPKHLSRWQGRAYTVTPQELGILDYPNSDIPILFGDEQRVSSLESLDIFGTIFFYLSRYEEYINPGRDELERFLPQQTLAPDFVTRPVVDEYLWLLRRRLMRQFPTLPLKGAGYRLRVSHDVDVPHSWLKHGVAPLSRAVLRALLKERSLPRSWNVLRSYFDPRYDPIFCFDWIMAQVEAEGLDSTFYVLTGGLHRYDLNYDLDSAPIASLLRSIFQRGHEIGLHGSIESAVDLALLKKERERLQSAVTLPVVKGRQHYLRFCANRSWQVMAAAGICEDSTLGYAEQAGFRCGTARTYPVFDVGLSEILPIKEQPLICMEHSLLATDYQALSSAEAFDHARKLWEQVKMFGGDFTLLWHNHNLVRDEQRELFRQILKAAS
jgi:peptidoglycan/xylan/chitin deacetylase (PgdA/CDA1 family)